MTPANQKPRILVVTSRQATITGLEPVLGSLFAVLRGRSAAEAEYQLKQAGEYAAVIAEHVEGSDEMIQLLDRTRRSQPNARRLLLAEACDLGLVVRALHSGAVHKLLYHPIEAREVRAALDGLIPATPTTNAARPAVAPTPTRR